MKVKCELFKVNGQPLFAPDADVDMEYNDLDDEDSGRDESGVMHRIVVRYKLGKWSFIYDSITEEEKRIMESIFPDAPDFEFTHPARIDANTLAICRAYRSNYGISWRNARTGQWKNYKFNIVEC